MDDAWDGLAAGNANDDGATWSRVRPGAVLPAQGPLEGLARDLVSGPLPDGVIEVDESAWRAWIARGPVEADPAAQAAAWADRLRAGDLPMPQAPGGAALPLSVEGGELLAAVRLAADHVHRARSFQDALGEARLEAMRELAYGAGHEINNPLANIATRAQTLLLDERDPERRRRLSTIVDQAFRARDLIGGLMLFARPPRPNRVATDLHAMVSAVIDRLGSLAGQRLARLDYTPAPASLSVVVDRSQVEEAIRAVVSNALEAVGEGGLVTVSMSPGQASGDCDLVIVDDGPGIDPITLRRVFDPFFSGREAGRGAGLGLSKAWRFLEVNSGTIEIESRAGRGTRVLIRLPLAESEGATTAAVFSPAPEGRLPDVPSLACASSPSARSSPGKVAVERPA
jgi:signal transduction histidine kinase